MTNFIKGTNIGIFVAENLRHTQKKMKTTNHIKVYIYIEFKSIWKEILWEKDENKYIKLFFIVEFFFFFLPPKKLKSYNFSTHFPFYII